MPRTKRLQEFAMPAGSPPSGEPVFLAVGRIFHPHGLHGELQMEVMTDFPDRLKPGATVFLGEQHLPAEIRGCRGHRGGFLIALKGYETPEKSGELRGQYVYVDAANIPELPAGEYYHHQILGLRVLSDEGRDLGHLAGILETGANDVYVVRSDTGSELLLPNIASIVLEINLERGEMLVHLLPGLIPE